MIYIAIHSNYLLVCMGVKPCNSISNLCLVVIVIAFALKLFLFDLSNLVLNTFTVMLFLANRGKTSNTNVAFSVLFNWPE